MAPKSEIPEWDPYTVLGLSTDADAKAIKSRYRKAALEVHPDRNPDDPRAEEKFAKLTRAKDLLLDPALRAKVDQRVEARAERAARQSKQDGQRKKLREELEARERQAEEDRLARLAVARGIARQHKEVVERRKRAREEDRNAMDSEWAEMMHVRRAKEARQECCEVRVTWESRILSEEQLAAFFARPRFIAADHVGATVLFRTRDEALAAVAKASTASEFRAEVCVDAAAVQVNEDVAVPPKLKNLTLHELEELVLPRFAAAALKQSPGSGGAKCGL